MRQLSEKQKKKIIEVKRIYDELGTLEKVGEHLGITRERVRQILKKGDERKIIRYKPTYIKGFDDIANKLKKENLEKYLVDIGSLTKVVSILKEKYEVKGVYIEKLIEFYDIDCKDLILQHRINKCILGYNEMVLEIGYHPTTTEMGKKRKWRALWHNIDRHWGSIDNFRKEFGIPIPGKGNPNIVEDTKQGRDTYLKEATKLKQENLERIQQFVSDNKSVTKRQIQEFFNFKSATLDKYLKELLTEEKINRNFDGKKYLYLIKNSFGKLRHIIDFIIKKETPGKRKFRLIIFDGMDSSGNDICRIYLDDIPGSRILTFMFITKFKNREKHGFIVKAKRKYGVFKRNKKINKALIFKENYDVCQNVIDKMLLSDSQVFDFSYFKGKVFKKIVSSINSKNELYFINYYYDQDGNLIEKDAFRSNGMYMGKKKYFYDDMGNKAVSYIYDENGQIQCKGNFAFNENKDKLKEFWFSPEGKIIKTDSVRYEYSYQPEKSIKHIKKYNLDDYQPHHIFILSNNYGHELIELRFYPSKSNKNRNELEMNIFEYEYYKN